MCSRREARASRRRRRVTHRPGFRSGVDIQPSSAAEPDLWPQHFDTGAGFVELPAYRASAPVIDVTYGQFASAGDDTGFRAEFAAE